MFLLKRAEVLLRVTWPQLFKARTKNTCQKGIKKSKCLMLKFCKQTVMLEHNALLEKVDREAQLL